MSWGEPYIERKATFVNGAGEVGGSCGSASISIFKVKEVPQVCASDNTIDIFVRNGDVELAGIKALVIGTNGVAVVENILSQPLKIADGIKTTIAHQPVGAVEQIVLTPSVDHNGMREFCRESETKIEDIRTC